MKTKSIIISLLILIVILVIVYAGFKIYDNIFVPHWDFRPSQISIQDKQITDNTKPFVIKISYPEIAGLNDFNQKAKAIVDKEIADFKTNSLANDQAVKDTDPTNYTQYPREYELDISYDKGQVDENIVSVVFNVYNFEGGAHGASYFVPLNYDVKNGTSGEPRSHEWEIKLADLFPNQPDYLQKISAFCTADLTKQLTKSLGSLDGTTLQDGAGPSADNFQYFLINPSTSSGQATITFYFPQYQVAYGAAGDFRVIYPR